MEKIFDAYHKKWAGRTEKYSMLTITNMDVRFRERRDSFMSFFWFLYFVILKQDYKLQKISHNFTPAPEKQECIPVKNADFTEFHAWKTAFVNLTKNASPSNMVFNK